MRKTKTTAQSTSNFSSKHQTSEISLKTTDLMLKQQKWQHCWPASLRNQSSKRLWSRPKRSIALSKIPACLCWFFHVERWSYINRTSGVDRYVDMTIGQLFKVRVPCRLTKIEHLKQEKSCVTILLSCVGGCCTWLHVIFLCSLYFNC